MRDIIQQFGVDLVGLDRFQRAYERLNLEPDRQIVDGTTVSAAAADIDRRIDEVAAWFPGNPMVESMAAQMKATRRQEMFARLGKGGLHQCRGHA
jgi:hypothetical protein